MPLFAFKRSISLKLLFSLYVPAGLLLLTAAMVSLYADIPFFMFTRDPADITHTSPFLGIVSNIGILLWCATTTLCFFSYFIFRRKNLSGIAVFFLASGMITCILMLDDLFMLHEWTFPHYFHWRQRYIYLTYVIMILVYLLVFRKIIFKSNFLILGLALGFFFLSVAVDVISDTTAFSIPFHHLFEDGFKFLGITSWLGYFAEKSLHAMNGHDG